MNGKPENISGENEWFAAYYDRSPVAVFLLNKDGSLRTANPTARELINARGKQWPLTENQWWVGPQDSQETLSAAIQQALSGDSVEIELFETSPDGRKTVFQAALRAIQPIEGANPRILVEIRDETPCINMQESLKMYQQMIEVAEAGTAILLFMVDSDGSIRFTTGGQNKVLSERMAAKSSYTDVYADLPQVVTSIRLALKGQSISNRVDIGGHLFSIHYAPILGEDGMVTGMVGVGFDVTRSQEAENALYESETRFKTIFDESGIGIVIKDLSGRVLVSNPEFQNMLGFSAEELHHKTFYELTHPADLNSALEMFQMLFSGARDTHRMQKRYLGKDGKIVWGQITASVLRGPDGKPQAVLEMVEDVTGKRRMESDLAEVQHRLVQSREMERLHLAQDLHDGPLQELYGISYQLRSFQSLTDANIMHTELLKVEGMLQRQITTLRAVCGELRPPALAPFGLEKAIKSNADSFRFRHPNIEVRLELMHDGQSIPEKIRLALFRIYQELLNNISRHARASETVVRLQLTEEQVILEIEDNGQGFQVPDRWVEIARQGHMGLIGASERAESVGGTMQIHSTPGHGTLIHVSVPRTMQDHTWDLDREIYQSMEK